MTRTPATGGEGAVFGFGDVPLHFSSSSEIIIRDASACGGFISRHGTISYDSRGSMPLPGICFHFEPKGEKRSP